ncbi:hypothetical protein ACVCNR_19980 (plasmid) [Aquamicrobium terrae]
MELGRQLARLTAGIDSLYRAANRGAGFLNAEGLIPVAMAAGIAPQALRDYDEAEEALIDFRSRLGDAETALRRDWLDEMSDSLLALVATFRGDPISFGERLERQIRVPLKAVPQPIIDGLHSEIRSALDELGFRGGSWPRIMHAGPKAPSFPPTRCWRSSPIIRPRPVPAVRRACSLSTTNG